MEVKDFNRRTGIITVDQLNRGSKARNPWLTECIKELDLGSDDHFEIIQCFSAHSMSPVIRFVLMERLDDQWIISGLREFDPLEVIFKK